MRTHIRSDGFTSPANRRLGGEYSAAVAQLAASAALVLSTLVAATAVARADVATTVIENEGSLFAIALLLGLLFIGMGGLTMLSLPHHPRHPKTHG